jgi:hypothetical protein
VQGGWMSRGSWHHWLGLGAGWGRGKQPQTSHSRNSRQLCACCAACPAAAGKERGCASCASADEELTVTPSLTAPVRSSCLLAGSLLLLLLPLLLLQDVPVQG